MKNNRPLNDFTWLCSLDKMKGLDLSDTYLNNKAALQFVKSIAGTEREKSCDILKSVNVFSFMMDDTTEISGDEQEAMYIRVCKDGTITERFPRIGTPLSTCSKYLFDFVVDMFKFNNIDTGM